MLKQQQRHHQIAIAGQVKDAITGQGIPGAIVKIIEAPDEFIKLVIFKTKLLGLPVSPMQWVSFNTEPNLQSLTLPQELQNFREQLRDPNLKSADKLKLFQVMLENANLSDRHKFLGIQETLDCFSYNPKTKDSQLGRTQTISEGWFYFRNLPAGTYRLEASLYGAQMRYTKSQCQIEIVQNNIIKYEQNGAIFDTINKVELKLKPTTLVGKITSADDTEVVGMAKVQIQGSEDYTFSLGEIIKQAQGEWNYRLVGIEARTTPITVIVSAKGYTLKQQDINLQLGEVKSLDLQLIPN